MATIPDPKTPGIRHLLPICRQIGIGFAVGVSAGAVGTYLYLQPGELHLHVVCARRLSCNRVYTHIARPGQKWAAAAARVFQLAIGSPELISRRSALLPSS